MCHRMQELIQKLLFLTLLLHTIRVVTLFLFRKMTQQIKIYYRTIGRCRFKNSAVQKKTFTKSILDEQKKSRWLAKNNLALGDLNFKSSYKKSQVPYNYQVKTKNKASQLIKHYEVPNFILQT